VSKADDPSPSSGEVKNAWDSTSILLHVFVGWCLNKQGEGFTLYVFMTERENLAERGTDGRITKRVLKEIRWVGAEWNDLDQDTYK